MTCETFELCYCCVASSLRTHTPKKSLITALIFIYLYIIYIYISASMDVWITVSYMSCLFGFFGSFFWGKVRWTSNLDGYIDSLRVEVLGGGDQSFLKLGTDSMDGHPFELKKTGWWFQIFFYIFAPIWGRFPI